MQNIDSSYAIIPCAHHGFSLLGRMDPIHTSMLALPNTVRTLTILKEHRFFGILGKNQERTNYIFEMRAKLRIKRIRKKLKER
jgi:hypothetical protein